MTKKLIIKFIHSLGYCWDILLCFLSAIFVLAKLSQFLELPKTLFYYWYVFLAIQKPYQKFLDSGTICNIFMSRDYPKKRD